LVCYAAAVHDKRGGSDSLQKGKKSVWTIGSEKKRSGSRRTAFELPHRQLDRDQDVHLRVTTRSVYVLAKGD
jgi:hypothetical protein